MLINRTPLTNAIRRLVIDARLKGCSKLDIYSLHNWRARFKVGNIGKYSSDFYGRNYSHYSRLYNQVFGNVEYISSIQRWQELQNITTQIEALKIFVRKDVDVEYDAMVYSFGCRYMHLLESTDEHSIQLLHNMVVSHIRHQCTSYDRMRRRLYTLHRRCYSNFITLHLKIKVLKEISKAYPKYSAACKVQIECLEGDLKKELTDARPS